MVARETSITSGLRLLGLEEVVPGRLEAYRELLAAVAIPRGFLGPREADRLDVRHILESAALAPLLPSGTLIDVGAGAGLPGVVLACLRRDPVILLEAEGRRADFLELVSRELRLGLEVLRGRSEVLARTPGHRDRSDVAVARALASPPAALELTLPLVRPGGVAILSVGPSADPGQLAYAAAELAGGAPRAVQVQVPGLEAVRWAIIVQKIGACPERYPRRNGVPSHRPLVDRGVGRRPRDPGEPA